MIKVKGKIFKKIINLGFRLKIKRFCFIITDNEVQHLFYFKLQLKLHQI